MARVFMALLIALAGYALSAVGGYFLVQALSTNRHDKSLEAAMTAAFVFGPLGALISGIVAFFRNS